MFSMCAEEEEEEEEQNLQSASLYFERGAQSEEVAFEFRLTINEPGLHHTRAYRFIDWSFLVMSSQMIRWLN